MRKIIFLLLVQLPAFCFAQQGAQTIEQALQKYQSTYPMEKVYVHTDKPYYVAGDTLRLQAYLLDATVHAPDTITGVLYVDLIGASGGQILTHRLLKASGGIASGAINLGDTLKEGNYQLRAYTNWMLNFPEQFFYHKTIHIYETAKTESVYRESEMEKLTTVSDVQFFPEGGNLIAGIENRVGFKAVNRMGKGIEFAGYLIADADTLAKIKSIHLGMGSFTFIPKYEKNYVLRVVNQPDNYSFSLPSSLKEGYTMMVDNLNKTSIKVFVKHNLSQPDRGILVAHQRERIFYAGQVGSDKNAYAFVVPKNLVPDDGIVHLTLFNSHAVPQCERIVYVDKGEPLTVELKPNKNSYHQREKVSLEITVADHQGLPVEGNFSLAITDESQVVPSRNMENIETYLLLSSDIADLRKNVTGEIEEPGYYFDRTNSYNLVHLDILLMTQGWRRFLWKDVFKDSLAAPHHLFEKGINVGGQVLLPNGKPSKKPIDLTIMIGSMFAQTTADANGHFDLLDLDFSDSTNIVVQGKKTGGGRNVDILFDEKPVPEAKTIPDVNETPVDAIALDAWLKRKQEYVEIQRSFRLNKVQTLKAVEIEAKREEEDPRRMLYGSGSARTIKVDQAMCAGAVNILQMIQGRIAGVQVNGYGLNMSVTIRGQKPALMVDGMTMQDFSILSSLSPCNVEAIDVINHPVTIVSGAGGGLISILTKRGNSNYDWSKEKALGLAYTKVVGFDVPRQFYSPKYEGTESHTTRDVRSTIFWQPNIRTDASGKAFYEYWNSDEKTTIRLSLEGISLSGRPVAMSTTYSVK